MAAPERFAKKVRFALATRAPSIHGPSRQMWRRKLMSASGEMRKSRNINVTALARSCGNNPRPISEDLSWPRRRDLFRLDRETLHIRAGQGGTVSSCGVNDGVIGCTVLPSAGRAKRCSAGGARSRSAMAHRLPTISSDLLFKTPSCQVANPYRRPAKLGHQLCNSPINGCSPVLLWNR